MKKNLIKGFVSVIMRVFVIGGFMSLPAVSNHALALDVGLEDGSMDALDLGDEDPRTIIARIINMAMLFLGIIAVVIILAGGFKWMTAGGNEDKVSEAKKLMSAGIVGIVIVLAAWGIANFILDRLVDATTQ